MIVEFKDYLQDARMFMGLGGVRIEYHQYFGETTICIIEGAVIDTRVDNIRVAWNVAEYSTYKNLEVYKGESELGRISKVWSVTTGPNLFFVGQLV